MQGTANCPYCRSPLAEEPIARCAECRTAHHLACWDQNGRCSVFGCTGSYSPRQHGSIRFFPGVFLFALSVNPGIGVALSFLFLPAIAYCLYAAVRSMVVLVQAGFLRHELSRREWRYGWITFGLNAASLAIGVWSWLRIT